MLYISQICGDDDGNAQCRESRTDYLWIPRQSTVWSQYMEILDAFGTYPTKLVLLLTVNDDDSILTPINMDSAFEIIDTINNITFYDEENGDYGYTDLCTRSSPTQSDCDSSAESVFSVLFQNNESLWTDMNITLQILNSPGAPSSLYFGGLEYTEDDPTTITAAQSMRLVYSLQGSTEKEVK